MTGVSVIIPALNEAERLPRTLAAVRLALGDVDLIVVDGGSSDDTAARATAFGCRVIAAEPGRGGQIAAGVAHARGPWLLLLHADCLVDQAVAAAVQAFIARPAAAATAAYFRFALDDTAPAARRLERLVAWRCRTFALPYGDQGLLLHRQLYEAAGGMPVLPLMEDVTFVRRLGRHRLVALDVPLITSAERWRRDGYLARSARNLLCLALWRLGVPARSLVPLYRGSVRRRRTPEPIEDPA